MRVVLLLTAWIGVMMVLAQEARVFGFYPHHQSRRRARSARAQRRRERLRAIPGGGHMDFRKSGKERTLRSDPKFRRNPTHQPPHTQSQSNPPPPHITGHNNDPTDDTPTTTQNYAPPTTDAAAPETLPRTRHTV